MNCPRTVRVLLAMTILTTALTGATFAVERPIARWTGNDFKGGSRDLRSDWFGMSDVNYVYAQPAGPRSEMTAVFLLGGKPQFPLFLHLQARNNDTAGMCPIAIRLNGQPAFEGPNGFTSDRWEGRKFPLPGKWLKVGRNEVTIVNTAKQGGVGAPPWFMVARAAVGAEDFDLTRRSVAEDFFVTLPAELRPIPEPARIGRKVPGFAIRGTKGWQWTPEQYLAEIPVLAEYKMNFLMNCYLSMFDIENLQGGGNKWWLPLPESKKRKYEEVVRSCQKHGIEFCFAMNPNLRSSRILDYNSDKDIDDLWQHYAWMADLGVNWFSICLDDIGAGIDPKGQSRLVNEILRRLRTRNPKARMIFCPTEYIGTGEDTEASRKYLPVIAKEMDPEVYCFWTGNYCVGEIRRPAAETYKRMIGHRLVIWDNYPVNDGHPTLHLGPVIDRDPDLCEVVDGYMANPLCPQNEINRIPLITEADYAYNPWDYDPARSIGQAILHLAHTPEQQGVLKDLVEMYPGMLVEDTHRTDSNPVIERFQEIIARPNSRWLAEVYLSHVQEVADRLAKAFPGQYADAQATLRQNLAQMRAAIPARYRP